MAKKPRSKQRQALPPAWVSALRLVHPFPSLVVTVVTVAFAFVADGTPDAATVAMLGAGMLCFQFAIGVANDVVDFDDDRAAKPWKALPRGIASRRAGVVLAAGFAGGGMAITSGLPFLSWLVGLAGLACGLVYDVQLKRTALSWLPFAIAFPLVPVWVFTALDRWDALLWWALLLGPLLGLALHLANQAPDVPRETHVRGLAHRLGTERSANLSLGLVGLAGAVAALVLLVAGEGSAALISAATVLIAGVLAKRATVTFGPDGLFGLLAASSAVLAVAFVSAAN